MQVEDINGCFQVDTVHELEQAIAKRAKDAPNCSWLGDERKDCPTLGVFVAGNTAYLHYIPEEFHPGFVSVGGLPNLPANGKMVFPISRDPADDIEALNE